MHDINYFLTIYLLSIRVGSHIWPTSLRQCYDLCSSYNWSFKTGRWYLRWKLGNESHL